MTLNGYFEEIESLEFQIQFSVLSGLNSLVYAMSEYPTLQNLIAELEGSPSHIEAVYERIKSLLPKIATETRVSYDESIAAYLFCLSKVDEDKAWLVCRHILRTKGTRWSRRLALRLVDPQPHQPQPTAQSG